MQWKMETIQEMSEVVQDVMVALAKFENTLNEKVEIYRKRQKEET